MIFTLRELFDVVVMTLAVGYIFMGVFKTHAIGFDRHTFLLACLVTAPALILHELAHKFLAIGFGLQADFHAAYFWLILGVVLRLLHSNFIFFIPAYVSIAPGLAQATPLTSAAIAFGGPLMNFVLFGISWLLLRQKKMKKSTFAFLFITKQINLFLFVFNMLPIPGFDGLKVYQGLYQTFF
ncbi:MAG: M50 family metallopeptidase [Candidatus Woesearchaeota archaeon]|nr:M50 family metallopeptidase [Candidatus Woesearchaeota archaeon]